MIKYLKIYFGVYMSKITPINAIRHKNALHLVKYFNIDRHSLASRMGISYTHLNGYLRPNDPKGIGHKTAQRFEIAFGLAEGELNIDLTAKYPLDESSNELQKTLPPLSKEETINEIIDQQILVVPLFLSDIDNGELNPRYEPCIDKTYIKVSSVVEQGINPNHVKAILFSGLWPTPNKITYYVDASVNSIDPFNVWHYLIAVDGKRKIMKLDLNECKPNMRILGRAFHVEQPLLGV